MSPVSLSICDIGDDDDAFSSRWSKDSSSSCDVCGEWGSDESPLLATPFPQWETVASGDRIETAGAGAVESFSGDWLMGEKLVSC